MQCRPAMFGYCPDSRIASTQLAVQFPNGQIADGPAPSVKEDMFEVQIEYCIGDREINVERVVVCGGQVKLMNHNGTQERCIDLIDVNGEAFLPGPRPNPPANAMGNSGWRKPHCQQCRDQQKQTNQDES